MASNAVFGRYWPADSPIHKLDPRTKLAGTLAFVVIVFLADSFWGLGVLAAFVVALFGLSRIPFGQALRSIAPLTFIIVLTGLFNLLFVQGGEVLLDWGWLRVSSEGVTTTCFIVVRLALLLLSGSALSLTTTSLDITEACERFGAPLARFGVPAHEFALVMGIAFRFLPQFSDEFHSIRAAQVARGATLATSPTRSAIAGLTSLLVPLFASAFRHADTLSAAMDARCYHGANGRTRLRPLAFARRDVIACAVLVALGILVVML